MQYVYEASVLRCRPMLAGWEKQELRELVSPDPFRFDQFV